MQGPTDEASVPTTYVIDSRILGVTMRRKIGKRTMPVPAEDLPLAKRARLQASTDIPTGADEVTTDLPDDTPTIPVAPAAALPSSALSSIIYRRSWREEEDAKLTEAVKRHGTQWVLVAKMVPGRTNRQCRMRWVATVDPANEMKGKWTLEEDAKLTEAVKKYGIHHWVAVAAMVPGRKDMQCRSRWTRTLDPGK
jgi:hypothetical protein